MQIQVLGCGGSSGVPTLGGNDGHGAWGVCDPHEPKNYRTRSSIIISLNSGENVLIDTGPDLRFQLLRTGITSFRHIIYTHPHADHIAGIDDVRGINRITQSPIAAYGYKGTMAHLQKRYPYIFAPWTPPHFFRAVIEARPRDYLDSFYIGNYRFTLFRQIHGHTESTGIRVGNFAYCTDVVDFPEESLPLLKGLDLWMIDCLQREPHFAHASLDKIIKWQQQLQPKKIILTHMGADMDWRWLQNNLPEGIDAAWDGRQITLS